ncbi:hypothetical protein [Parachitinimonas caeni]|uniref:Uncharacterized protein n=1 Tax=Parachitinimonas caeni TaxID=3031301 RepID=A0ABT7E3W4_9NEIS|nr:hypothetical protein [Parachitinimonas caeni]MDK2127006.1 hypothetical protein [Parachitinimonas caeni]
MSTRKGFVMNTKNKEVLPDLMKMDLKLKAFPLPIKPTWRMRAFRYISTLIGLIVVLYPQYFAYYPYYVTQYTDIPKLEEATVLEGTLLLEPATSKFGNQIGAHHYVVTKEGGKVPFQWDVRYWNDTWEDPYAIYPKGNGLSIKIWYHQSWGVLQAVVFKKNENTSNPDISFDYMRHLRIMVKQKEKGPGAGYQTGRASPFSIFIVIALTMAAAIYNIRRPYYDNRK